MNPSPADDTKTQSAGWMGLPAAAIAYLALTAALSLAVSHYRLPWFDEYLLLNTDSLAGLRHLWHVQRTTPIALDPFGYHLFAYIAVRLFGLGPFAVRLPSMLGYLLMQVCLFRFVRRIATERAALFAMIFPSLVYAQYFAVDARPYGLVLGMYALVLVCWQSAARRESGRTAALVTMAVALAVTLNLHYFAVLLLIPLYLAEAVRSLDRGRLDRAMLAAMAIGSAGILFVLPFVKGVKVYREHYIALNVDAYSIPLAYRTLLVFPDGAGGLGRWIFLVGLILSLAWACVRFAMRPPREITRAECALFIGLLVLPLCGYVLAVTATHSIYARYIIATTLGMAMVEAIAVAPLLRSRAVSVVVFGFMLLVVLGHGAQRIAHERHDRRLRLAQLQIDPAIKAAIVNSPTGLLYVQDQEAFYFAQFYEPDREIRRRLALVSSYDKEMELMHQDTYWLQNTHLGGFADVRAVMYEDIAAEPGEHVFVNLHNQYQWLDGALAESRARVQYLGPAFGPVPPTYAGDFVTVEFPQAGK